MVDDFLIQFPVYIVAPLTAFGGEARHGLPQVAEVDAGKPAFLLFTDDDLASQYIADSGQEGLCLAVPLLTPRALAALLQHAEDMRGVADVAIDLGFNSRRSVGCRAGALRQRLSNRWERGDSDAGA